MQSYFLELYASGRRQCRLGYDSSPQCDSFQLGEMIRQFVRKGTLVLQSSIIETESPQAMYGSLKQPLYTLMEFPEYQVNSFHSHCGFRSVSRPALQLLSDLLLVRYLENLSICWQCWKKDKLGYSWLLSPTGGVWKYKADQSLHHAPHHTHWGKDLCTAERWEWT